MASQNFGDRFRLLIYDRALSPHRRPAFLLATLLLGLWYLASNRSVAWPQPPADGWLLAGGLVSLAYWLFALLGPRLAYVQPRQDHLRLQTPIYRLKVSYRRIHNTRPLDIVKVFPPGSLHGRERRLLEPFYGDTALGVDLRGWPLSPGLLRLFFSRFLLAPDQPGLLLVVDDWMALSNQLASRMDHWRAAQAPADQAFSDAARILQANGERRSFWRR